MSANIESEAIQFDRAADAADIDRILFDHGYAKSLLCQ